MSQKKEILPNFLIVGAQKAGTTTLSEVLQQHSRIFIPIAKELHFFDDPKKYSKGLSYYSSLFSGAENAEAIGEITPVYLFYPDIPEKIANMPGKAIKIIIVLRNPADRAISHFKMEVSRRHEKRTFAQAMNEGIEGLKNGVNYNPDNNYLDRGFYAGQIKNYFRFFPAEHVLIIIFEEDFIQNRVATIKRIFNFLGVENENVKTDISKRQANYYRSKWIGNITDNLGEFPIFHEKVLQIPYFNSHLLPQIKKLNNAPFPNTLVMEKMKSTLLTDLYYDDIKKVELLIGRDLCNWYTGY